MLDLGCWGDTSDRAIATLEGLDDILDGSWSERINAIDKCKQAAISRGRFHKIYKKIFNKIINQNIQYSIKQNNKVKQNNYIQSYNNWHKISFKKFCSFLFQ